MKLSESHVTAQVKGFLEVRGWRPVRFQRAIVPGAFQSGEPGQPDFEFIRYAEPGWALVLWIEFKSADDRRKCRCLQNLGTRKRCTVCDQAAWKKREELRGGMVIVVSDLEEFEDFYDRSYGWLHTGDRARGQLRIT